MEDNLFYLGKDTFVRADINQHLCFDTGILFIKTRSSSATVLFIEASEFPTEAIEDIHEAYNFMKTFLKDDPYLVGDHLTLVDLCCVATVSTAQISAKILSSRHPRLYD